MWLLLTLACSVSAADPAPAEPALTAAAPEPTYAERTAALTAERDRLAALPRSPAVRDEARAALLSGIDRALIPPWFGTPWAFHGTTQTPGEGAIACGYFVSTVLRDAGLPVERVRLAQQASEYIVKTFSEPAHVRRFRTGDVDAVVDRILAEPEGLYVVGLDVHVGFLVRTDARIAFCHSTFLEPGAVVCEDPRTSPAFVSNYHVVGPVLEDRVVDAWLDRTPLPTVTR